MSPAPTNVPVPAKTPLNLIVDVLTLKVNPVDATFHKLPPAIVIVHVDEPRVIVRDAVPVDVNADAQVTLKLAVSNVPLVRLKALAPDNASPRVKDPPTQSIVKLFAPPHDFPALVRTEELLPSYVYVVELFVTVIPLTRVMDPKNEAESEVVNVGVLVTAPAPLPANETEGMRGIS